MWCGLQLWLGFEFLVQEYLYAVGVAEKEKKVQTQPKYPLEVERINVNCVFPQSGILLSLLVRIYNVEGHVTTWMNLIIILLSKRGTKREYIVSDPIFNIFIPFLFQVY